MTITFRYKCVERPDGTPTRTPSIPITLYGDEVFETIGLVDSGADVSAIPKEIAELLGLNLSGETSFVYGIGGRAKCVDSQISIMIKQKHETYRFNIPVKVVLDKYDFPVILGRDGLFNRFVITFKQKEEKIILKKIRR